MNPCFLFGVHCELHVPDYAHAVLSVPALSQGVCLDEKDLLAQDSASTNGKATLDEHLAHLRRENMLRGDAPLLVLGLRNNLVNLRSPVIWRGRAHAVEGERPGDSLRPYYGIGIRDGRLTMGQALGGSAERWPDFFCAGIPVLWDDVAGDALLDLILAEAADHSHVFDLPRGNHPDATPATRAAWARLHDAFRSSVHADLRTAVAAVQAAVTALDPPPRRCDNYLHAVLGAKDDGTLICIYASGRLEALGHAARNRGCRRAVCVENSGSIMPTFLPDGIEGERIPLLRAPNFRPHGRAVLVLELKTPAFGTFPMIGA